MDANEHIRFDINDAALHLRWEHDIEVLRLPPNVLHNLRGALREMFACSLIRLDPLELSVRRNC